MLEKKKILELFEALNTGLEKIGERGEVGIVGGSAMCLVYNARASTKDVDAVFSPTSTMRKLAEKIADEHGVEKDWLNDGVKGYLEGNFKRETVLNLSHLRIWTPEPKYMLAMKCISARWDTLDRKDVIFLIKLLKIAKAAEVFKIIEGYYPKNRIPAKTQFFLEELFE